MTEEIIKEELDTPKEESDLTPEQTLASEGGWRPEEEYEGETGTWIDARTFNMRGELLDRIKSQTSQLRGQDRKIGRLEEGMKNLAEHNNRMDEVAFKKALTELKGLKRDALDVQDHDQVTEIDDQIADLKASKVEAVQTARPEEVKYPEVEAWVAQNSWYNNDTVLTAATDALTLEMVQTYPELKGNPAEVLKRVKNRLQEEFPEKFGKTPRKKTSQSVSEPGQADESSRSRGAGKKFTSKQLNEVQLEMGKTFVASGAMKNLNEYAEQLAEIGELDSQKGA